MNQFLFCLTLTQFVLMLSSACGNVPSSTDALEQPQISQEIQIEHPAIQDAEAEVGQAQTDVIADSEAHLFDDMDQDDETLKIQIGDVTLTATLEDNPSVDALKELLVDGQITIAVQNYGGFEKVGTLPHSLPRNDRQTTAVLGDIMLYQGNSLVIFYGSNSWAYTKLGTITGFTQEELRDILSGNDSTVTLSMGTEPY